MRRRMWATAMLAAVAIVLSVVPLLKAAPPEPPGLSTEDGRLIPLPHAAGREASLLRAEQQASVRSKGPAILVKRRFGIGRGDFKEQLQAQGFARAEGLLGEGWWRVPLPEGQNTDQALKRLRDLAGVETAEEDGVVQASFVPDDPYFAAKQWDLQKVQAPAAWDLSRGSADVWIAAIDSGIDYQHPDRPADLWLGFDFYNSDADPYDDFGHGTHVAGIAAAATDNGAGIAGLCPACGVLVVKALGANGTGYVSDVADAIRYAAEAGKRYGKRTIINLSLGGPYSQIEADAVSYAQSLGALVVAAAGNRGASAPDYPAAFTGVLAVSATTPQDTPAYYSQYGDIAAPGGDGSAFGSGNVWSTVPTWYANPPYEVKAGTSMASPHAAGAAGLAWSLFPRCTPDQLSAELLSTADIPNGWQASYGTGRLNVDSAILRFTTDTLPSAAVGSYYRAEISARGGSGAHSFELVAGALPPGLGLSTTGLLSGTPTGSGYYTFSVQVADSVCEAGVRSFTIPVGGGQASTPPQPGTLNFRVILPVVFHNQPI